MQEGFINVFNDTASMYQAIVPAGALQPHTQYLVTFDVGNRDVTDNGNLPNNDMDPFISVRGFFTLGGDLVDFSKHVGSDYQLSKLSGLADGAWQRDNTILLDTSVLSPGQLSEALNVVLQATSTTTLNRGQVDFDNVRLTVVPEPSALALAGIGTLLLLGYPARSMAGRLRRLIVGRTVLLNRNRLAGTFSHGLRPTPWAEFHVVSRRGQ